MRTSTLALVVLLLPSVGLAQGLGAAAEKEKQRRKNAAKDSGTKVVTDQDLARNKGVLANGPVESPQPGPDASAREASDRVYLDVDQGNLEREAWQWRARAARARERISAAKRGLVKAQIRVGSLKQGTAEPEREAALKAVTAAERELEAAKTAQVDMEEEARRAGAAPGWLRE